MWGISNALAISALGVRISHSRILGFRRRDSATTKILPIEDGASLYREGTAMHHCVGTYGDEVRRGECYVYSIRRNDERVATVALYRHNGRAYLEQIRGPCNTKPPKAIAATVVRWLHAQRPLPPCKEIEATLGSDLREVAA